MRPRPHAESVEGVATCMRMRQLIRSIMDQAVANGLNVMRAWAAAVDPEYALQTSPGKTLLARPHCCMHATCKLLQKGPCMIISHRVRQSTTSPRSPAVAGPPTLLRGQERHACLDAACTGQFSEPMFRGLDYALDQARQRGLKVRPASSTQARRPAPCQQSTAGHSTDASLMRITAASDICSSLLMSSQLPCQCSLHPCCSLVYFMSQRLDT